MLSRLSLRARLALFFLGLAVGVLAALAAGLWFALHRSEDPQGLVIGLRIVVVAAFLILALIGGIAYLFDVHLAKALDKLAGAIRARAEAGVAHEIDTSEIQYLGSITGAVSDAAIKLAQARSALAESVARETARLAADKAHLEHLLADVPPGVLLCTGRHHIAFYNGAAQQLLDSTDLPLCLDKNLFDYLHDGPVRHAHQRLLQAGGDANAVELICTTQNGQARLAVRMRLAGQGAPDPSAYVLTLRNVTAELSADARRDLILQDVLVHLGPLLDSPATGEGAVALRKVLEDARDLHQKLEALDMAQPSPVIAPLSARRVAYDFELLTRSRTEKISDARLDDLTYVVFDTETTGLLPDQGDEIVQLAAVRIVNGKRVPGEQFDILVNPGRKIPASSSAVHGITDEMVKDAPGVLEALERFRLFAEGAVLVAHNAPFDLEFLRRRESALKGRFENPVLDTVLLSAVVFGRAQSHTLDALAERLDCAIPSAERHTAIGDAKATAEVFLRLKAMLEARKIERFGEVLREVRRHNRLLRDANREGGPAPS